MLDTLLCWSGLSIQHFWVVWSFVYCCAGLLLARLTGKPMQAILSRLRHLGISWKGMVTVRSNWVSYVCCMDLECEHDYHAMQLGTAKTQELRRFWVGGVRGGGYPPRNLWRDLACKQLPAAPSSSRNPGSCQNWIGSQSCCASDHHTFRLWDRQMDRWTDGRSAVALSGNGQMSSAWSPSTPRAFLFKSALRRSADLTQSEKWWFNRKKRISWDYTKLCAFSSECVWVCANRVFLPNGHFNRNNDD